MPLWPSSHPIPSRAGWGYRKQIRIDHARVAADQTNFPVLISTTDANWKSTGNGGHVGQADGGDFVFTAADGVTQLDHELEKYDATTGEVVAWVRIPSLSSSTDTTICLYYGNAGTTDKWNPQGVWSANFRSVWHLPENQAGTGTVDLYQDSTANNYDGDDYVASTGKTGRIGSGQQFNGTSDYIEVGNDLYESDNTGSISAWVKLAATGVYHEFFTSSVVASTNLVTFGVLNTNYLYFQYYTGPNNYVRSSTALDTNWHHVTVTTTGSAWALYIDGTPETLVVGAGSNTGQWFNDLLAGTHVVRLGRMQWNTSTNYYLNGNMDEVRVSSVARSASWIATEYANQAAPAAFYLVSYEEAGAAQTPHQAGWGHRNPVTIDHAKVSATLTDFPLLVNTTHDNWKSTANGGYVGQGHGNDFLFTASDGVTKLNHEIESYDPVTGQLVAWVRVPSLSSVSDTMLFLNYGQATAVDQWNPQGVWDANYKGVWHLGEGAGDFSDATANANTGTDYVSASGKTGQIGSGQQFDGTNDYVSVADSASLDTAGSVTYSAWVNASTSRRRGRTFVGSSPSTTRRSVRPFVSAMGRSPTTRSRSSVLTPEVWAKPRSALSSWPPVDGITSRGPTMARMCASTSTALTAARRRPRVP